MAEGKKKIDLLQTMIEERRRESEMRAGMHVEKVRRTREIYELLAPYDGMPLDNGRKFRVHWCEISNGLPNVAIYHGADFKGYKSSADGSPLLVARKVLKELLHEGCKENYLNDRPVYTSPRTVLILLAAEAVQKNGDADWLLLLDRLAGAASTGMFGPV